MRQHLDAVTGFELAEQQLVRERIQEQILNGAFERARAELRIVTFFSDQLLSRSIDVERQLLLRRIADRNLL